MEKKKVTRKFREQERNLSKMVEEDFTDYLKIPAIPGEDVQETENTQAGELDVKKENILDELERLSVLNASKSNLKDYIKNLVDMITAFAHADVISVKLFDSASGDICYRYITGKDGEFIDEKTIELEEKFSQKTIASKDLFLTSNTGRDEHYGSIACFPLLFREHLMGVLSLLFRGEVTMQKENVSGLKICAANLALMVHNVRLYSNLAGNHVNIIRALVVSLEARDRYTHGHSQRVTQYALDLARVMNCTKREIKVLSEVAPLHDIGKIAISDTVLNKIRRLTDEEFAEIKSHSAKGSIMLQALGFDKESVQLVRWHHEAYDGRGYPDRLKGEEIPLLARILCLADAYDAMTSDRPYRAKLSDKEAYEEIRHCSGTQFCPKVVNAFLQLKL
jgi:HD-GYP domain-containing protein (c-di-GMP phosphodiesterase class II)